MQHLQHDETRVEAMKKLLVNIHPTNFPANEDAHSIYEDLQAFYDSCCAKMNEEPTEGSKTSRMMKLRRKTTSPDTVIDLVVQFNVRQKWPWLDGYVRPLCPETLTSGKVLAPLVAYQCINSRGAIAHGKRPSLIYSWENVVPCTGQTVMEVLNNHGGFKSITGGKVDEIKMEIIQNGPVISFTFQPTSLFALENKDSIVKSRIKKHHYCLIVGWRLTEFGEVWLVQSYTGKEILQVPVGQYSIDETIIAPKDSYVNVTWQQGPYYDNDMSAFRGWNQYDVMSLTLKSKELEELAEIFGEKAFHEVIRDKVRFVIRDKKKNAHSRSCILDGIKWETDIKAWKVSFVFNDNGSSPLLTLDDSRAY